MKRCIILSIVGFLLLLAVPVFGSGSQEPEVFVGTLEILKVNDQVVDKGYKGDAFWLLGFGTASVEKDMDDECKIDICIGELIFHLDGSRYAPILYMHNRPAVVTKYRRNGVNGIDTCITVGQQKFWCEGHWY